MTDSVDCLVIGAGVIGLSVAATLAESGMEVVVIDAADCIGSSTSSRNSGVIHSGIYYPTDSLKAKLCVEGRKLLYDFCATYQIPHQQTGKLIVAHDDREIGILNNLHAQAQINEVGAIAFIDGDDAKRLEPNLDCHAALHIPMTGIIDTHAFMETQLMRLTAHGGILALHSRATHFEMNDQQPLYTAYLQQSDNKQYPLHTSRIINCAGLSAISLAKQMAFYPPSLIPEAVYAKGNYFSYHGKAPFSRLIYPAPEQGGLGVHYTLDLAGQARFGPDVEWLTEKRPDDFSYNVDQTRADQFYALIRHYFPALPDDSLTPDYAGIRPKLRWDHNRTPANDFTILSESTHECKGLIQCFGIESPGLTSSLALAMHIANLLK